MEGNARIRTSRLSAVVSVNTGIFYGTRDREARSKTLPKIPLAHPKQRLHTIATVRYRSNNTINVQVFALMYCRDTQSSDKSLVGPTYREGL